MQVAKAVTSTTRILLLMTITISPIGALLVWSIPAGKVGAMPVT